MSVIAEAKYDDEIFDVEIFRDGSMGFPGHDMAFDQAMHEFGSPATAIMGIFGDWNDDFDTVIFYILNLPVEPLCRLAMDYAEHVLPILKSKEQNGDLFENRKMAIQVARKALNGKLKYEAVHEIAIDIAVCDDSVAIIGFAARMAAESTTNAVWSVDRLLLGRDHKGEPGVERESGRDSIMSYANVATLRALGATKEQSTKNRHGQSAEETAAIAAAIGAERLWQIRRFVDCFEAVGNGLPWPPMDVTE